MIALVKFALPKTGQKTSYLTGDDGDLQKGVAWPNPRFTDNSDGTVTDNLTGLIWTKDANLPGKTKTWQQALDYVAGMNEGTYENYGHTDWRLPNRKELRSLVDYSQHSPALSAGHPFTNVQSFYYWSSSTSANRTGGAWSVNMWFGYVDADVKPNSYYVWPVRAGQSGSFDNSIISLPKTGQSTCYDAAGNVIACSGTGQDGEIKAGVAWPNPRFTVGTGAEAECVTDNLTGLMWVKSPDGTNQQWSVQAFKNANKLSLCGHTDWRLPNVNELESLVNAEQSDTAIWLNRQGFSHVQSNFYWSSSTDAGNTVCAWVVHMCGSVYSDDKSYNYYVWPVRSGQ